MEPLLRFVLVISFVSKFHLIESSNLYVQTLNGKVSGSRKNFGKLKAVRYWLGIPYAKPPVGPLRFKRPEKIENWLKPITATKQPNVCYQTSDSGYMVLEKSFKMWDPKGKMSEDCLYLNIYVPENKLSESKLPVVVWIHGGGFYKGAVSLDQYDPMLFAHRENITVVTIQYRLGNLGLLYFKDIRVPGNMGLLDQAMAIQWISDNIEFFGGNKNDITLMGESAGSASVGYHMVSHLTKDLFHKAIMQSGSPFCFWAWALPDEQYMRSLFFAWNAKCYYDDLEKMYNCLMKKTAEELLAADISPLSLAPTNDGYFINTDPFAAVSEARAEDQKPILAGLVQNEGMPGIIYFMRQIKTIDYSNFKDEDFKVFFKVLLRYSKSPLQTFEKLAVYYLTRYTKKSITDYGEAAEQIFGDYFISCCSLNFFEQARHLASPLYFYYFNHRSQLCPDPSYTDVMHGSEIQYQFGQPLKKSTSKLYDTEDKHVSMELMDYWGKFVRTGKPSNIWPNYFENRRYILIESLSDQRILYRREPFCIEWNNMFTGVMSTNDVREFMAFAINERAGIFFGALYWDFNHIKYPKFISS